MFSVFFPMILVALSSRAIKDFFLDFKKYPIFSSSFPQTSLYVPFYFMYRQEKFEKKVVAKKKTLIFIQHKQEFFLFKCNVVTE